MFRAATDLQKDSVRREKLERKLGLSWAKVKFCKKLEVVVQVREGFKN